MKATVIVISWRVKDLWCRKLTWHAQSTRKTKLLSFQTIIRQPITAVGEVQFFTWNKAKRKYSPNRHCMRLRNSRILNQSLAIQFDQKSNIFSSLFRVIFSPKIGHLTFDLNSIWPGGYGNSAFDFNHIRLKVWIFLRRIRVIRFGITVHIQSIPSHYWTVTNFTERYTFSGLKNVIKMPVENVDIMKFQSVPWTTRTKMGSC